MITDEALMLKAQEGDMTAISDLFLRYHKELYTFFFRCSRNDSLSKDLVQNVFERIIKYKGKYRSDFPFKSWIFKLAWNEQNDYHRKKKITLPGDDRLKIIMPKYEERTDDAMDERKVKLQKAMSRLSLEQRELINLTLYQGFRYAEVADIMGCSLSAVKVRVHRTMKNLRSEYHK